MELRMKCLLPDVMKVLSASAGHFDHTRRQHGRVVGRLTPVAFHMDAQNDTRSRGAGLPKPSRQARR